MSGPTSELVRNEIVRAGAGAGKTTELTQKILDFAAETYARTGDFPKVIATTFTRKATQELRERLMLKATARDTRLLNFVNSKSHLLVSTIHGILDLFLKRYGQVLNLDPGYTLLSGLEARRLARTVARDVLFSRSDYELWLERFSFSELSLYLNELARLYLRHPEATGFTIEDFEAVALAHWRRLATEVEAFVREVEAAQDAEEILGLLSRELTEVLEEGGQRPMRELQAWLIEKRPALSHPGNGRKPLATRGRQILKALDTFLDGPYNPARWQEASQTYEDFQSLATEFTRLLWEKKRQKGVLEIEDLELMALKCVREFPDTARSFSEEWDYWLIDEYQDTSPVQIELLKGLVGDRPHFVVGDPQQSIYLFRGARSEVFAQKQGEMRESGGVIRAKEHNYRSRPELLHFFNDMFTALHSDFASMKPHPEKIHSANPETVVAEVFPAESWELECQHLLAQIVGLLDSGVEPHEICILARRHKILQEVAGVLGKASLPIQVHSTTGFYERREIKDALALLRFFINPHDNKNLVLLLRSPWFRESDADIIAVTSALGAGKEASFWLEFSKRPGLEAIERLQKWLALSEKQGCVHALTCALVESGFVDASHRYDSTGRRESNLWKLVAKLHADSRKPAFNPLQFVSQVEAEARSIDESEEGDAVAAVEPNRINLMTVHGSKGLEFRYVFVPCMGRALRRPPPRNFLFDEKQKKWGIRLPDNQEKRGPYLAEESWRSHFSASEDQEQLRLLYVALTRASEAVYLSWEAPAGKESWASLLTLETEPGVYQRPHYAYRVHGTPAEPKPWAPLREHSEAVRPMWRSQANALVPGGVSVTDLIKTKQAASLSRPQVLARSQAALRGVATHRILEILKYPSRYHLPDLIARWFRGQEEEFAEALRYVVELQEPPVSKLIQSGHVEWSFSVKMGLQVVDGQIDLWGYDAEKQKFWVIDYKTGRSDRREEAFQQMQIYAQALHIANVPGGPQPHDQIQLAAIYPFSGEVFIQAWGPRP